MYTHIYCIHTYTLHTYIYTHKYIAVLMNSKLYSNEDLMNNQLVPFYECYNFQTWDAFSFTEVTFILMKMSEYENSWINNICFQNKWIPKVAFCGKGYYGSQLIIIISDGW